MEHTKWCPHCGDGPVKVDRNDRDSGLPVQEFPCGTQIIGDTTIRMDDCYKRVIVRLENRNASQSKVIAKLKAEIADYQRRFL